MIYFLHLVTSKYSLCQIMFFPTKMIKICHLCKNQQYLAFMLSCKSLIQIYLSMQTCGHVFSLLVEYSGKNNHFPQYLYYYFCLVLLPSRISYVFNIFSKFQRNNVLFQVIFNNMIQTHIQHHLLYFGLRSLLILQVIVSYNLSFSYE